MPGGRPKKNRTPLPPVVETWVQSQRSANTARVYSLRIRQLLSELKSQGVDIQDADIHHLVKAYNAIRHKMRTRSPATLNLIIDTWRSFYSHLVETGQATKNPAAALKSEPRPRYRQPTPSDAEVKRMWKALSIQDDSPRLRRDRAVFVLLALTALRGQELRDLRWRDFDWHRRVIRVTGKGGAVDEVKWPEKADKWLREYYLGLENIDADEYAFQTSRGGPLSRGNLVAILESIAEAASVRPYSPHAFRRYVATELIRLGVPLTKVQRLLRHQSIETTAGYDSNRSELFSADPLAP